MSPGYKTSEFWLSFAAMIVGAVMASGILEQTSTTWDNQIVGLIAMVLTGLGYTVSRMVVKSNESKASAIAALGPTEPDPS